MLKDMRGDEGEAERAAQELLRQIVAELEAIGKRLTEIHDGLPVSRGEDLMLLGEEDTDVATEVRLVIECVLNDSIRPAIRDLKSAAAYSPSSRQG